MYTARADAGAGAGQGCEWGSDWASTPLGRYALRADEGEVFLLLRLDAGANAGAGTRVGDTSLPTADINAPAEGGEARVGGDLVIRRDADGCRPARRRGGVEEGDASRGILDTPPDDGLVLRPLMPEVTLPTGV